MKTVRIDVNSEQFGKLRQEVFCNQRLNEVQRRREVRKVLPLPLDGSKVDLYCDGKFVGTV
ncbi:MAG: hypothetical protein ACYC66_04870 [Chloroflexota bacterium]